MWHGFRPVGFVSSDLQIYKSSPTLFYRLLVVALVEGRDEAILIEVDPSAQKLLASHHLVFPGVRFPSHAAFDSEDRLWVVGGAPLEGSRSLHIGVAKRDLAAEGALHKNIP